MKNNNLGINGAMLILQYSIPMPQFLNSPNDKYNKQWESVHDNLFIDDIYNN